MALIAEFTLYVFTFFILSGLMITAISGSVRPIKIYLVGLGTLSIIALIVGIIASGGILVFLLFQLITLIIFIFFSIIAGAALGGLIHKLIHYQARFKSLNADELSDYIVLDEFSEIEKITKERVNARVKSGFYQGGKYKSKLYIHRREISNQKVNTNKHELQHLKEFQNKN